MSLENTAQPTLYKTPAAKRNVTVSFVNELEDGDLLTGTPTITVSPSGPTLSAAIVNTASKHIEIPDKEHWAKPGQAVQFSVAGGTAAVTYTISVQCNTEGGQNPLEVFVTLVVQNS
jgi:hypothetical protein